MLLLLYLPHSLTNFDNFFVDNTRVTITKLEKKVWSVSSVLFRPISFSRAVIYKYCGGFEYNGICVQILFLV